MVVPVQMVVGLALAAEPEGGAVAGEEILITVVHDGGGAMEGWRLEGAARQWCRDVGSAHHIPFRFEFVKGEGRGGWEREGARVTAVVMASRRPVLETPQLSFIPAFIVELGNGIAVNYLVVMRADRPIGGGGDNVVLFDGMDGRFRVAKEWFLGGGGRRLWSGGEAGPRISCGEVEGGLRAVLTVFFEGAGAAVVERSVFRRAVTQNAQVGTELEVVMESPPLGGHVVFVRMDADPRHTEVLGEVFAEMGRTESGRQLMRRLRWKAVHPVQPSRQHEVPTTSSAPGDGGGGPGGTRSLPGVSTPGGGRPGDVLGSSVARRRAGR